MNLDKFEWMFLESFKDGEYVLLADINITSDTINSLKNDPYMIAYKAEYHDGWDFDESWTFTSLIDALTFLYQVCAVDSLENE